MDTDYQGFLFIGDPHLASQTPGFRKDDFPRAALEKLHSALTYAQNERLLPAVLGDLFHYPRDNANWLICELIDLFSKQETVGIYGNHDCREDSLQDHDSFSILEKAKVLRIVDGEHPWTGRMNGRNVVLGGSSRCQKIPDGYSGDEGTVVVWMTHHDLNIPGFEQGFLRPKELPGIHIVVNGHIHRSLETVICGETSWLTPGNITRVSRSDASRAHHPSVLRINIDASSWEAVKIPISHAPFEDVFHMELISNAGVDEENSSFIRGLRELENLRTTEGAGFQSFLEKNLKQFDEQVQKAIWALWDEVNQHG